MKYLYLSCRAIQDVRSQRITALKKQFPDVAGEKVKKAQESKEAKSRALKDTRSLSLTRSMVLQDDKKAPAKIPDHLMFAINSRLLSKFAWKMAPVHERNNPILAQNTKIMR